MLQENQPLVKGKASAAGDEVVQALVPCGRQALSCWCCLNGNAYATPHSGSTSIAVHPNQHPHPQHVVLVVLDLPMLQVVVLVQIHLPMVQVVLLLLHTLPSRNHQRLVPHLVVLVVVVVVQIHLPMLQVL